MTSTILTAEATVKYGGKTWDTKYGPKTKAVVILAIGGSDVDLWGGENDAAILGLKAGDKVSLIQIKGKWKLATQATQPTPNPTVNGNTTTQNHYQQPKTTTLDNDTKREIIAYVEQQATLLSYCYEQAYKALNNRFPHSEMEEDESFSLDSEPVRSAALTLYLSVQKHFSL